MKLKNVIVFLLFLLVSCQNKRNLEQMLPVKPENYNLNDTLVYIAQIDNESIRDTIIDVLQYFDAKKLPKLYRLGGIAYEPYFLNGTLVKLSLVFEGDRETLSKVYYFNKQEHIYYIVRTYSTFDPPKWEVNSKKTSIKRADYYVINGELRKLEGDTIGVSEIRDDIEEIKKLIQNLKIN